MIAKVFFPSRKQADKSREILAVGDLTEAPAVWATFCHQNDPGRAINQHTG
jgi:hypothetical protein